MGYQTTAGATDIQGDHRDKGHRADNPSPSATHSFWLQRYSNPGGSIGFGRADALNFASEVSLRRNARPRCPSPSATQSFWLQALSLTFRHTFVWLQRYSNPAGS